MTIRRYKARYIYVLLALLLLIASVHGGRYMLSAFADVERYTSVTADLKTDVAFDPSAYPYKPDDYTVEVIQIAESASDELYVYTYQPSGANSNVYATEISISTDIHKPEWRLYPLTCVSAEQTLFKYVVDGITVSDASTRYYNISEILRPFIYGADKGSENNNTVNEKAYKVGQQWTVITSSDGVYYSMTEIEVVTVTAQMIGFRRYSDGFQWSGTKSCDAHYMLFNCDHDIDKLISADIAFKTQEYGAYAGKDVRYEEKIARTAYLRYDDQVSNDGSGWFGKKEKWQRMASTSEFMEAVKLRDDEQKIFRQYAWVLNFYETEYMCEAGGKDVLISCLIPFGFILTIGNALSATGTIVSDVTLLRLEFDYDGKIYNLGVVSDKQTGSRVPTNGGFDFFDWLADSLGIPVWAAKALVYGIAALVVLAIALPVLSLVFPVFGQVLKTLFGALWTGVVWLLKGILWFVLLPFKGIAVLVRKIKDKKDGAA